MTSSKDQIQALISEIDGVLQKTTPRLPWVGSGDATQQRRMLERVRNYLVALQKRTAAEEAGQSSSPDLLAYDIYYQQPQGQPQMAPPQGNSQEMTAQQMLQTIMQEMSYLRSNMMQPLKAELETLRQQREGLIQEIRHLEGQRRSYPAQTPANQQQIIAEFLQVLMGRLQDTLSQQVSQTLKSVATQSLPYRADPMLPAAPATPTPPAAYQSLESLQAAQANSDQMLVNLDATLRAVFDALQRDVKAYQESLSQGLDRMHTLGQQGEMMFSALINHLAQQLGREASSYLQPPSSLPETETDLYAAEQRSLLSAAEQLAAGSTAASNLPFPYPGTELAPAAGSLSEMNPARSPQSAASGVDEAIEAWLSSTSASLSSSQPSPVSAEDLSAADFSLSGIDLSAVEAIETTSDIDAALKLLDQLSSEIQGRSTSVNPASSTMPLEQVLGSQPSGEPVSPGESSDVNTESEPAAGDTRNELDEFYESLFGSQTVPSEPAASMAAPALEPEVSQVAVTGQISGSAGLEDTAAIDPTLGWDLVSPQPLQAALSAPVQESPAVSEPLDQEPAPSPALPESADDWMNSLPETPPSPSTASEPTEPTAIESLQQIFQGEEASTAIDPGLGLELTPGQDEPPNAEIDQISSLTDLFEDPALADPPAIEAPPASIEQPPAPETSAEAVTPEAGDPSDQPDQMVEAESAQPLQSNTSLAETPVADATEDAYIPASPDESLLPANEPPNETLGLWIDETTLSSLSEDLSSLEGATSQRFQEQADDVELGLTDWTLDDFLDHSPQALDSSIDRSTIESDQPLDQPLVEEDWSDDSLDDFAAALPESDFGETDPIGASEVPFTVPTDALTLEGMDDLFADVPPVDAASLVSDTAALEPSPPATLEDIDSLFAEAPAVESSPVPPPGTPAGDPPPFTLEGMDDLFAGIPSIGSSPVPPPGIPAGDPPPFTLEGMDDLFADAPTMSSPAEPSREPGETETLEATDSPSSLQPNLTIAPVPAVSSISEFKLEQRDNVFVEVPLNPPSAEATAAPSQPFALEYRDGVFVEVPLSESQTPEKKTELT